MVALLRAAVELGVTFFDTAEVYGPHANEALLGEALAPFRNQVVIATKFGWAPGAEAKRAGAVWTAGPSMSPVVEGSLARLRSRRLTCITNTASTLTRRSLTSRER